jgi:phenylalanyl-tRNA synthetase alpha chain
MEQELKALIIKQVQEAKDEVNSLGLSTLFAVDHQKVVGELKGLNMSEVLNLTQMEKVVVEISEDGKEILEKGSPEFKLVAELLKRGDKAVKKELDTAFGEKYVRLGFAAAIKSKWIEYDKPSDTITLKNKQVDMSKDETFNQLKKFTENPDPSSHSEELLKDYEKKRKFINRNKIKFYKVEKGPRFDQGLKKQEADLTTEMLSEMQAEMKEGKDWSKLFSFKKYNYLAEGKKINTGGLHPLLKVRTQFREILLELGFQEMPTNNFVESSFWNFDSLFQPQQHPARDSHDTFFLSNPRYCKVLDKDYFMRVKNMHQSGGQGSVGWQYVWSEEEATKNILRTHTTAVSARMLYKMAQDFKSTGVFTPRKWFSIDRVFRNESLDSTHLAEFHQIEGLIADYNLGLGELITTIEDFFCRFGIKKLKFKPAYNPYTEPSMEIFAWHEGFKKYVEIGNSGIFRPEMLLPMGLPEDVSVIAWGLSLERPTMIHYGYKNIRDLFGHEVNVNDTKKSSIYCININ